MKLLSEKQTPPMLGQTPDIAALQDYLRRTLAELLSRDEDDIDFSRPLIYLGVESLVALELERAVFSDWQVKINLKQQLQEINASRLAEIIAAQMIFVRRQFAVREEGKDWETRRL